MFDLNKLEKNLTTLTGYDFETAEKKCRKTGDMTPDIAFSKKFAAQLAAKVLECKIEDVQALNIRDYTQVTSTVTNFLFGNLVDAEDQAVAIEK